MASSTLDSFITSSNPPPVALVTSNEIHDRGSSFIGYIYRASSPSAVHRIHSYHKNVVHGSKPASHEIAAWRCMALRAGRDGLGGLDDFELVSGKDDDGEDNGGRVVLKTMEKDGVIDAVVIVSRRFGGTLLGPIRFKHIETCTEQVCLKFKAIEDVEAVIEELKELDEQLAQLRAELAAASPPENSTSESSRVHQQDGVENSISVPTRKEPPDYRAMLLTPSPDLSRARRLVTARKNAIRSVEGILTRKKSNSST